MPQFKFDDQKIHYEVTGQGPPLILLHNGGGDLTIWRQQIPVFSQHFTVYAMDFLGCGRSDRPDRLLTLGDTLKQLELLIQENDLKEPVIVGNCVGASTALEYSRLNPQNIRSLILVNLCGGSSFAPAIKIFKIFPFLLKPILRALLKFGILNPRILWGKAPAENDPLYQHYLHQIYSHPGFLLQRFNMVMGSFTFDQFGKPMDLPSKMPPTMLVWGEQNRIMPFRFASSASKTLLPKIFLPLRGAGHMCFYEQAESFNQQVLSFLGKHP